MFRLLKTTVLVIWGTIEIFLSGGCANQNEPAAKPKVASIEAVRQNTTGAPTTDSNQRVWDRPASGTSQENPAGTNKLGATQAPLPMVGDRPRSTGILLTSAKPAIVKAPVPVARPETVIQPDHTKPTLVALPVPAPPPTQAPSEPLVPSTESKNFGTEIALGVGAFAAWLVAFLSYRNSETAGVHRRAREIEQTIQGTLAGQKELLADIQKGANEIAATYQAEIRHGYLSAVSIDEVRKIAPGVRLQPLHDRGISTLLAAQGWDASKLQQLRGIGPDSARKIALGCAALTTTVNGLRIPHPKIDDGGITSQKLFRQLYNFGQVAAKFQNQDAVLNKMLVQVAPRILSVRSQTTFLHWIFGSQKKGALSLTIAAGHDLEKEFGPQEELGRTLTDSMARLSEAKSLIQAAVPAQTWREDFAQNSALYRTSLENLLGPSATASSQPPRVSAPVPQFEPVPVRPAGNTASGFAIKIDLGEFPSPGVATQDVVKASDCWVSSMRDIRVGSVNIHGGLVYFGRNLRAMNGGTVEPALINPALPVSSGEANCHARMLNYWSNYSFAAPAARASYLQWLETGRSDPAADVGYAFLYFYGLERRALGDALVDPAARAEIPPIVEEVKRLRVIYGSNGSFGRYSGEFLDYIEASSANSNASSNAEAPPTLTRYDLSFSLRRKLGHLAKAGDPLPPEWAYAWYHNDPRTRLPAAAVRCPTQSAELFAIEYKKQLGAGLVLPSKKTKLKVTYRPASPSFGGRTLVHSLDLPDVSVLAASYATLDTIALECFRQLDGYSRFIGRNKGETESFAGLVLLPPLLWPASLKSAVDDLGAKVAAPDLVQILTFQELFLQIGQKEIPVRATYNIFCRALGQLGLGLEPDPGFGGDLPSPADHVAIFKLSAIEAPSAAFGLAALLSRLAAAVAAADGDFSEPEIETLRAEIQGNAALRLSERQRLLARLAIDRIQPPPITGLKPTIERMNLETRLRVIDFLLVMVYADRVIAPEEVKLMEKIYTLFGQETAALYTRLHELSAGSSPAQVPGQKLGAMKLDAVKIQQLKVASAEVTKKLAEIFEDRGAEEHVEKLEAHVPEPGAVAHPTLLNLDDTHADLLAVLVGRAQWTRAEFEELCADKGLMPDGALERINDAAFAKYDQPLIEGEDPLEVGVQLLEKI